MTKNDLIEQIRGVVGETREKTTMYVDIVFAVMREELRKDRGKVSIQGFGTLERKETRERKGRNPRTGEEVHISAGARVAWKPAGNLLGEKKC